MSGPQPTLEALIEQVRSADDASELDRLTRALDLSEHLGRLAENLVGFFVDEARRDGLTWTDIGTRLGVSRQAVQKRFIPTETMRGEFWDRAAPALRETGERAHRAAQVRRKTYLGTEHLLLGLIDQPDDPACLALAQCDAGPDIVRGAIDGRIGVPRGEPLPDETPMTTLALRCLQHAQRESLRANAPTIDTSHLVLALLTVGDGLAHDILTNLGVNYDTLRATITGTQHHSSTDNDAENQ